MRNAFIMMLLGLGLTLTVKAQGLTTQLELKNLSVEYNGSAQECEFETSCPLLEDEEKSFKVFQSDQLQYDLKIRFARSGNRIKMRRWGVITLANGDIIKGKMQKEVQFIKTNVPGEISKKHVDQILIDKKSLDSFKAVSELIITYKQ